MKRLSVEITTCLEIPGNNVNKQTIILALCINNTQQITLSSNTELLTTKLKLKM